MKRSNLSRALINPNILLFVMLVVCSNVQAQKTSSNMKIAVESAQPLGLSVDQGMDKKFLFDYSIPEEGLVYKMHVTLRANEVSWKELREGGRSETDAAQSVKLDDHRIMMTWFEESGQFVVLYVDFKKGQSTYCGLLRPGVDKKSACYSGTLVLQE